MINSMGGGELFNRIIKRAKPFTEQGKLNIKNQIFG